MRTICEVRVTDGDLIQAVSVEECDREIYIYSMIDDLGAPEPGPIDMINIPASLVPAIIAALQEVVR